jgi:hypothetical protein
LQTLVLDGPPITDAGQKELKEIKSLKSLSLIRIAVTDAGVQELEAERPGLQIRR